MPKTGGATHSDAPGLHFQNKVGKMVNFEVQDVDNYCIGQTEILSIRLYQGESDVKPYLLITRD